MAKKQPEPADQTEATSLSPIADYNTLELTATRDILPLKGAVYDVATSEGMAVAKADLKLVTSFLTRLEAVRKQIKDPPFRLCQQIDAEAKRIAQPIERDVKAPLKALIDAEEGRLAEIERKRVAAIRAKIDALRARPAWGASLDDVQRMLQAAEAVTVDDSFAELQDDAVIAKAEALRDLRDIYATACAAVTRQQEQAALVQEAEQVVAGHARLAEPQPDPLPEPNPEDVAMGVVVSAALAAAARPAPRPADDLREAVRLMDSIAFGLAGPDAESLRRARFLVLKVIGLLT